MTWKLPLFKIYWDENDVKSVAKAIEKGMQWAIGPNIEEFEKEISEFIRTKYAVVFNSGTSALHAALLSHGVGPGDEVIVPSFTFIATANAPLFVGAKPIFADIEEKTWGLDPEDVNNRITPKTRAIIPVHYGGCPCLIEALKEIAEDNNLVLVEDAAEAFGAGIGETRVGAFGDSAMLSFCQNKIITTGEGGAIVTQSKRVFDKLRLIRSHGRSENQDYFSSTEDMDYVTLGHNFRMSNLLAALGRSQLRRIEKIIELRQRNANYMTEKLKRVKSIKTPSTPVDFCHVYQMYSIRTSERDRLMGYLADRSIMTKVYFTPVHLSRFYIEMNLSQCRLPVTEMISNEALTLPMFPTLTFEEMDYMIGKIRNF